MTHLCVKCQAQFQPKQIGVTVIETSGNPPKAFRIWSADLLACPICGMEVASHFSHEPAMESHEAGFEKAMMEIPADRRHIMFNPAYLVQRAGYETKWVRSSYATK